jgi:hypothetical protein
MRSQVAKAVKKEVERQMSQRLKEFSRIQAEIVPNFLTFTLQAPGQLSVYVAFQLSPKSDSFTVECALSEKMRFPNHLGLMTPRANAISRLRREEPIDGEFRFRIGDLLEPPRDLWWHLSPPLTSEDIERNMRLLVDTGQMEPEFPVDKAKANLAGAVNDAIDHVLQQAVPYLEEMAHSLGHSLGLAETAE